MGRGPKPAKSKEAKRPVARKSLKNDGAKVRDLEKRLEEALQREAEAQEQQAATAEILQAMRRSPADTQPVFDAIVSAAARLLRADGGILTRVAGELIELAAFTSSGPAGDEGLKAGFPVSVHGTGSMQAITVRGPAPFVSTDFGTDERLNEGTRRRLAARGFRSGAAVPLIDKGISIGALSVTRRDPGAFAPGEIALLQTFAAQAVIAIENVRLFTETKEALERQTATSEILRVISSSPTNLQPVLDAVSESASRLCEASDAVILLLEGTQLRTAAHHGRSFAAAVDRPATRDGVAGRAVLERETIHLPDVFAAADFPMAQQLSRADGTRTVLATPLMREGVAIGAILIRRGEVRPFSDKQIELLKTFADQAVIAIENVRLFKELEVRNRDLIESLARQMATSEVLRVISQSPTDLQPVFDTIAENARRLLRGYGGLVVRFDGQLLHVAGMRSGSGRSEDEIRARFPMPPSQDNFNGAVILDRDVKQIADIETDDRWVSLREHARRQGWRANLGVPMMHNGQPIGGISVVRREPGGYSPQEVELLKIFADQAVIAIENVRLFKELEARNSALTEALEQQTATSEILRVISASPTDVRPVMDAIAENAARLCGEGDASRAGSTVWQLEGSSMRVVASYGVPRPASPPLRDAVPLTRGFVSGRVVIDREIVHIRDLAAEGDDFAEVKAGLLRQGVRTLLGVPLLQEGTSLGAIVIRRFEVRPFTDKQIALVKTFADQAVIAIENVRLFTELQASNRELRTALDTQTATSDILRVISQSQTDVQPVFEAIVRSAARLCHAANAAVFRTDGRTIEHPAAYGAPPDAYAEIVRQYYPMPLTRWTQQGQAMLERSVVYLEDSEASSTPALLREAARRLGFRSQVTTPMLRDAQPVGAITVTRGEPGRFTDAEVALLQTFADQAVIAIENVRLFTELQEKNRALTQAHTQVSEALEQQTATSEILRVISGSPTDVEPVFRTILANANTLCDARFSVLWLWDGEALAARAHVNVSPGMAEHLRTARPRPYRGVPLGLCILEQAVVHVPDILTDPRFTPEDVPTYRLDGARSTMNVPMVREGSLVGVINVWRREPQAFTDAQIDLLKTFADQAVIAVENVRLFKELEARTTALTRSVEQLTALGEVGRAVSSTLDLETVLTTIVSRAVQLSGLDGGVVHEYDQDTEEFVQRAQAGTGGFLAAARRATRIRRGHGAIGRTATTLEPVQVADITVPGAYVGEHRENLIESGVRAVLAVPMVRESRLIGCLGVTRNRPGEFPAETIELLRTFATQSALAIQNARLFHEIEDKSRQLEAASRHKSEFLANMSHELRTPLNAILGFSEVLSERMFGELNEKQEEYLKDIYASGNHLLSLINDILDLSKIEAGRMELELSDFHLPTALDSALTLVRERAGRRGIALQLSIDQRLGQIQADERKVRQVVLNLLSNAIKFTPEGGRIEVRATPQGGLVEVSVSDTGVGIAPEDQEAVFEEFRQVGTADKKVEGTGLGLTLCRKFVELHGGRIWVKSELGAGSTFTFTIPVRREPSDRGGIAPTLIS